MKPEDIIQKMQLAIGKQNQGNQQFSDKLPGLPPNTDDTEDGNIVPEEINQLNDSKSAKDGSTDDLNKQARESEQPDPSLGPIFSESTNEASWMNSLPEPADDEFLIDLKFQGGRGIFCVKELTWYDALAVEQHAFRKNDEGEYFSGEYERRETLRKAIVWAAEWPSQKMIVNIRGSILKCLHYDVMELLWPRYFEIITPSATEADALYTASLAYFRGTAQEGHPTPPIVVEVDMMLKFGGLTRTELRAISYSEMERMQLVLMARAETMLPHTIPNAHIGAEVAQEDAANMPAWMLPTASTN